VDDEVTLETPGGKAAYVIVGVSYPDD